MKIGVGAIGLLAGYYLAARFSNEVAGLQALGIALIWLPAGVAVVAFMALGWWAAPLVLLASLLSPGPYWLEDRTGAAGGHAMISAVSEVVQGALVWRLFRSDLPDGLASVGDLLRLGILACFVPIIVGGLETAGRLLLGEEMAWQRLPLLVMSGGFAHALAIIVAIPAYWAWRHLAPVARHEKVWIGFYCILIVVVLYGSLRGCASCIFLSVPILLGLGMNTGLRGEALGQALLFLGLIAGSAHGVGPFAGGDEFRVYADLLTFIGALGFTAMAMAVSHAGLRADGARLADALEAQRSALEKVSAERRQLEKQALQRAHYDALTGLPNRAMFFDRLEQAIIHARRRSARFALLFIDLDGFKAVNDTGGHQAGDVLLRQVGERLRGCVRESDTIARMGGDEFTVIVSDVSFRRSAAIVADKVIASLAMPFAGIGEPHHVGASVGIAIYPDDGEQAEVLLKHADAAMYAVKRSGKNGRGFYADGGDEADERG